MKNAKVVFQKGQLKVALPLTRPTGKVRVKKRSFFADRGVPFYTRQQALCDDCYVEWQIGYDLPFDEANKDKSGLNGFVFDDYRGKRKIAYELAEILCYSKACSLLKNSDFRKTLKEIEAVPDEETFEKTEDIARTDPKTVLRHGLEFYSMKVTYPLFVHRFGAYEIFTEVMIREQQRATDVQAMLYVCIPVKSITFSPSLCAPNSAQRRILQKNECGYWQIGGAEAKLALEMVRIFGMLSPEHKHDVREILKLLISGKSKCA